MRKPTSMNGNLQTRLFLAILNGFVEDPTSLSLGAFYNNSLKSGDLVQKPFN